MESGEDSGVLGNVPEFGAIFMANINTKKECFRRKLFGLPWAKANFAKQVKTGMILFLFEHERRELFGVFQATSDGAINIVPNAFSSSGMFPAQVRVASLWFCSPLSEHEFRNAIKENYFSAKKFNFGLSEDQVRRLLCLFSSRKINKRVPRRQFARETTLPFVEDRGQIDDDTTSDVVEYESNLRNYPVHHITSKFRQDSLEKVKRVDYERYSACDIAESEDKVDYELDRNVRENELFDYGASHQNLRNEHNRDSIGKSGLFLSNDRKIENEMDNVTIPVENSFNNVRRVGVDRVIIESNDRGFLRNNLENENKFDNSFGSVISNDHSRFMNDDRFRKNDEDLENFYSTKLTETEYTSPLNSLKKMPMFDRSYHSSHDEIVSRTVPYDPDAPDIFRREPLPLSPSYIDLNYRSPSKIESTPHHHSEFASLNSCLDFHPGHGNKIHLPEILPQIQKINRVSTPVLINPSFAFENRYPVESHQDSEHKTVGPNNDEALNHKDSYSPDTGTLRSDNKNNRTSVFSRLSLAPKSRLREQENHTQVVHDSYGTDSSVDDVMHVLRQSQNRQIMTRKFKPPIVRRQYNDESVRVKDFFAIHDTITYEQSRIKTLNDDADAKMENDVNQIFEKSGESLLQETRLVDFKRRSSIKRNLDKKILKDSVDIEESKGQLGEKPSKRRKLVRPKFEKDSIKESFSGESTQKVTSASHNDTSPNVDLVQETCSISREVQIDGNSEDKCDEEEASDNNILNKLSNLLSRVKSRNVGVGPSNEEPRRTLD